MKVTQKDIQNYLKIQLATNPKWALRALERIHSENQTEQEKACRTTIEDNGIGFTGVDGFILSSFATQYKRRHTLSDKQMDIVYKKMPKYWKQVLAFAGKSVIVNLISSDEQLMLSLKK